MEAETILKAVADRTRQRTVRVLRGQELSVSELVEVLGQPQSTVSRHLRVLREAGMLRDRRDGNTILYSLPSFGEGSALDGLSARLVGWLFEQPMEAAVDSRLQAVINRRQEKSRAFFTRVGRRWDQLREQSFGNAFHLEAFWTLLPGTWTVADIGTGTGYLLPALGRRFAKVIAVEPVKAMLEAARQRVAEKDLRNVELVPGDLAELPIADDAVDLAVASLVLHHVSSAQDALAEMHRIVRADGRIVIIEQTAHCNESFHERMQDRWWGFEPEDLVQIVRGAGFKDAESHELTTVDRSADAPDLFVVTARRGGERAEHTRTSNE